MQKADNEATECTVVLRGAKGNVERIWVDVFLSVCLVLREGRGLQQISYSMNLGRVLTRGDGAENAIDPEGERARKTTRLLLLSKKKIQVHPVAWIDGLEKGHKHFYKSLALSKKASRRIAPRTAADLVTASM